MLTTDARVSCHSCSDHPGHDEHGNTCPRCKGEGLRDAREAAAHVAMLAARQVASDAAATFSRTKSYRDAGMAEVATANVKRARDRWENELARVAREEAAVPVRVRRDSEAA